VDGAEPPLDEVIRTLTADVARRVRGGESRESVRDALLADGLPADFVDGILAGIAEPARWSVYSVVAITLSVAAFGVLPIAGAIAGVWVVWSPPASEACGMWVFPALFLAGCAGLLGLAAGVGVAFAIVWGLSELSDRLSP
jgi:hypothetical protein